MKVKDLLNTSIFGSIATVTGPESLEKVEGFLAWNKDFIQSFQKAVIALNFIDTVTSDVLDQYKSMWSRIASNCEIIVLEKNAGHQFGTMELEEAILKYIKENEPDVTYLFKSSEDVLLSTDLLEKEIIEGDFYFLPAFSFETIQTIGNITPQTNFYIINVKKINNLYGDDVQEKKRIYEEIKQTMPHIKPWEVHYLDGLKFDCESHLQRTVTDLMQISLLDHKTLHSLLNFVGDNQVGDPSHKNLYFKQLGICHYHFWKDPVYYIE